MKQVINKYPLKKIYILLITLLLCFGSINAFSQKNAKSPSDSSFVKKHSPGKAMIFSLILPGAGQVYNKKIWKVPIIYLSLGTLIYYADRNQDYYQRFRRAYLYQTDTLSSTVSEFNGASNDQLLYYRKQYRRNRDLCILGITAIYILNIIDANVDANLFDFDVSDNLSMRLEPGIIDINNKTNTIGLRCVIKF